MTDKRGEYPAAAPPEEQGVLGRLPGGDDGEEPCRGALLGPLPRPSPPGAPDILLLVRLPLGSWPGPPALTPPSSWGPHVLLLSLQDWPLDDGRPPPGKVVGGLAEPAEEQVLWDDPGSCVAVALRGRPGAVSRGQGQLA